MAYACNNLHAHFNHIYKVLPTATYGSLEPISGGVKLLVYATQIIMIQCNVKPDSWNFSLGN